MKLSQYPSSGAYDEMFRSDGQPRPCGAKFVARLQSLSDGSLQQRQQAAELSLQNMGITFNVYGHKAGTERVWPFDLLPRIIEHAEWTTVDQGLRQRIHALNLFVDDIYNDRKIFKDRAVPEDLIDSSKTLRPQCVGFRPPQNVWCHITGVDLIRDANGQLLAR